MFYLVYGLTSGGIERISVDIYKYLDHDKIDEDLVTKFDTREFFDDELELYGGKRKPILKREKNEKGKLKYLVNLINILKDNYDIAYFCLSKPRDVFKYPVLCKIMGIKKIIIHSHNSWEDKNTGIRKIMNFFGRYTIGKIANIKIACSTEAALWMFPKKLVKNQNYLLMKNGIDTSKYVYNIHIRKKMRKLYHCENKFVIGHVGRFTAQKNHKFILDIFSELIKINENSVLFLIGCGELEEEIKSYSKHKGIYEKIIFSGEKKDIYNYMQMFDAFLLPSLYEGLPVVGVEAQASGLKCFFSDVITKDINITQNITYIGLDKDAKVWADRIFHESINFNREDVSKKIIDAGFDIETSVQSLEKMILEQTNSR